MLLSRPRDTSPEAWARVVEGQRAGAGEDRVSSALDLIRAILSSTYYGVARATQDLDIVCEMTPKMLDDLAQLFAGPDFYLSLPAARQAVESRGIFNVVHIPTGWKIDFILRKDRPFSRKEFARKVRGKMFDKSVFVSTAEDTVLAKLEWAKASRSERQLRDVAEVLDVQKEALDRTYLESGIRELQLEEMMERVKGPW